LDEEELMLGFKRIERLIAWLQPKVVCFAGLQGWRVVVDGKVKTGVHADFRQSTDLSDAEYQRSECSL